MRKNKMICSLTSVFLAVLMIVLGALSPIGAVGNMEITEDTTVKPVVNSADKIDPALKEIMAEASPDEKIPVAIWLEDIDKEELETTVEQTCGISKSDISVMQSDATVSTQLYQAIDGQNEAVLQNYVEEKIDISKEQRAMKKLYNSTLRSVASDFYAQHNEAIVSDTQIQTDDIIFLSNLTPFMIAEVESTQIAELSANENIMSIGYYNDNIVSLPASSSSDENFTENMAAMNIDKAVERFGLTGDGVTVLMIDGDYVRSDHSNYYKVLYPENIRVIYNQNEYLTTNTTVFPSKAHPINNHANHVVGALQSVASDAFIYSVKKRMYEDIEFTIENKNIDVINASINHGTDTYDNSYVAQWFDALVNTYGISLIASAGNDYGSYSENWPWVISPSSGYNSIAVGVYNSQTGKMRNYRYNLIGDSQYVSYKPDIVAGANDTSTGAPYITAIVAMMTEMNSDIANNPALVKAILMASCHAKALPYDSSTEIQEDMFDGLTMKQGAGKVDAYKALCIAFLGTYDIGSINIGNKTVASITFSQNNNTNVSLAWLRDLTFSYGSNPALNLIELTPVQELELNVFNNNEVVANSNVTNSGKQLAYFSATQGSKYDICINKSAYSLHNVSYACAWSTSFYKDLETVQINGNYAKNQQLSVTATCNDGTTVAVNTLSYQWQSSTDGNTWSDISGATSNTYTLTNQEFLKYVRCRVTPVRFFGILSYPAIATCTSKVIIYGDCDLDGVVTMQDVTKTQNYTVGSIDLSEDQKRAADVDGDGDVDTNDATLIQKYVSSLITVFPVE